MGYCRVAKVKVSAEFLQFDDEGNVIAAQVAPEALLFFPHEQQLHDYISDFEKRFTRPEMNEDGETEELHPRIPEGSGEPEGHSGAGAAEPGAGGSNQEGGAAEDQPGDRPQKAD